MKNKSTRQVLCYAFFILAINLACSPGNESQIDAGDSDAIAKPVFFSSLDLLFVITQGRSRDTFVKNSAEAASGLVNRIVLSQPKSSYIDMHIGFTTAKVEMPSSEACIVTGETKNGYLRIPTNTNPTPTIPWPKDKHSTWPPKWGYLTGKMYPEYDLKTLVWFYVKDSLREPICNITQYFEVASLAIDGRNTGFIRPNSLIVIIILGDREDCSTKSPLLWKSGNWMDQYLNANDRCLEPVKDLLYPLGKYINEYSTTYKQRKIVVGFVGNDKPVLWKQYSSGAKTSDHPFSTEPTPRFKELYKALDSQKGSNLEAFWNNSLSNLSSADDHSQALNHIADRVVQLLGKH